MESYENPLSKDRDTYEKIGRAVCENGADGLPVSQAGVADDATNGFHPSNTPPGADRSESPMPSKVSGPSPSKGYDYDWPGSEDRDKPSAGPVASEEFTAGYTPDKMGRSD